LSNTVTLTLKINDNGDLALVTKEAKKTAAGLGQVDAAAKKAATSQDHYNRGAKGVGQTGLSAAKGFSKMRDSMTGSNGLVGAYATLAANVFALTALFGALSRASALEQLSKGLVVMGNEAGRNLPYVANELRKVTDAAISTEQAMRATAIATSAGFSTAQLTELTKVAKGASIALGRDMGDALDRLVRGTAKLEPEILDELGIMVRLDEASQTYADSLGKTVTQLTRYEKQQAFLNATIEEGSKKFSTILDKVDPDPYTQLSAAFADATKSLINFINIGLAPLAKYLSEFPTALYAGMLLFASTIVKQVVPALNGMAAKQREVASFAAMQARKATKVVSEQYTNAATKVGSAFKTVPKSLDGMAQAAKRGTLTLAEQDTMIKKLSVSEKLRENQLEGGNAKTYQQRKLELQQIKDLKKETIALRNLEGQRFTASKVELDQKSKSRGARRQAAGYDAIDRAGPLGGFGAAGKFAKAQTKELKTLTGGIQKFTGVVRIASQGVGLFGRALLNAIPFFGQIAFAVSMLLPLFGDLFKASKESTAFKEVKKSFDSFTAANQQLVDKLKENISEEEKYQARLKVRVGILDQVSSGVAKVIAAQREDQAEDVADAFEDLIDAQKRLQSLEATNARIVAQGGQAYYNTGYAVALVTKRQKEYQAELDKSKSIGKERVNQVLAEARAMITSGSETKAYAYELAKYAEIQELLAAGDGTISASVLSEMMEAAREPATKLQSSIEEANEASNKFANDAIAGQAKIAGSNGVLFDTVNGIANSLKDASDQQKVLNDTGKNAAVTDQMKEQEKVLRRVLKLSKDTSTAGAFAEAAKKIAENNVLMATGARKSKNIADQAKRLSKFSSANETIEQRRLDLLKESAVKMKEALQAELDNEIVKAGGKETNKKILDLKEKIKGEDAKIAEHADSATLASIAGIKGQQKLLGLATKRSKIEREMVNLAAKQAKEALKLKRVQAGSNVEKDDELKILQASMKKDSPESKARVEEAKVAKERVRLEFSLLGLQFDLEEARIRRLEAEGDLTETQMEDALKPIQALKSTLGDSTSGLMGEALSAEDTKAAAKGIADANKVSLLTEQSKREQASLRIALEESYTSLLRDQGLNYLADRRELNVLAKREEQIRADLALLEEGSTAQLKKQLELQNLLNQKAAKEREIRNEALSNLGAGTGSNVGGVAIMASDNNAAAATAVTEAEKTQKDYTGEDPAILAKNAEEVAAAKAQANKTMLEGGVAQAKELAGAMRGIGPEGELMAAVLEGSANMATSFSAAFEIMNTEGASTTDKLQAGLSAVGSVIASIGAISKASSDARIRGIDEEINAEKKRDGSSKQSLAKIAALEKKKEDAKRKAFETDKKMKMAQTVIGTAQGVISMLGAAPPPFNFALAGMVAAMGVKQLSMIAASTFQGGSAGSASAAVPGSIELGKRGNSVDLATSQSARGEQAYLRGADGTGGSGNFTPAFTGAKYRAAGGETAGFMVGEQGPEMFIPDRSGRIAPADEVQAAGAPAQVTFNINTIDSGGVEDMLTLQRGNIIGMIREAANSYGQSFVEEVDTTVLQPNAATMGVGRY
tara:strand:+ start:770 stop:5497 length:4728 start_codon:yes stop_codon:yes gene_type:complete